MPLNGTGPMHFSLSPEKCAEDELSSTAVASATAVGTQHFNICDSDAESDIGSTLGDDAQDFATPKSKKNSFRHSERADTRSPTVPVDSTVGKLQGMASARMLGRQLGALRSGRVRLTGKGKTASSAGSVCGSSAESTASSTVSSPRSLCKGSDTSLDAAASTRTGKSDESLPKVENTPASLDSDACAMNYVASHKEASRSRASARLLSNQLKAVKSDVQVDQAKSAAVAPEDSVAQHFSSVMRDLSTRQRREVQRHIDSVMRSAAERMGCRNIEETHALCERANSAIAEALERRSYSLEQENTDSEQYEPMDSEWDMALRAKIRLATCVAWERNATTIEDRISKASQEAWERRKLERSAFNEVEMRILLAAQEACQQRGAAAAAAFKSMPRPAQYRPAAKPSVHIPDEKLDECIKHIVGEAKERNLARHGSARPQMSHTSFNDEELCVFINNIAEGAKNRAATAWFSAMPTVWEDASTHGALTQAHLDNEAVHLAKDESENVKSPRKLGGC